jgi:tetratricopeptide (TPR) repeat protein
MRRPVYAALVLAAFAAVYQVGIRAENTKMPGPTMPSMRTLTPEELAVQAYNSGVSHRDKGRKAEQDLTTAKESDRVKLEKKAADEYGKALKDFKKATELNPRLHQAYNGMGFAYRKLGDHSKALEFYDKALQLAPGFPEALEYRGEAYLGLNRIDDAKNAYLELLGADRAQAALLMAAMKDWLLKRRANPEGVDPASLTSFESWITERSDVAKLTASMGYAGRSYGW